MAAVRPIVLVYQDFAEANVPVVLPDLNVCVVGPAYRIFDYPADSASIDAGAVGTLNAAPSGQASQILSAVAIPNYTLSDTLDSSSVAVTLGNARVELAYGADGGTTADSNAFVSTGVNFETSGVVAGDKLVLAGGVVKTIKSVAGTTAYVTTNFTVTTDPDNLAFSVQRDVASIALKNTLTINAAGPGAPTVTTTTMVVDLSTSLTDKRVAYAANTYIAYRALRTDLSAGTDEVRKTADITALIGKIDERNPLAVGAFVAFQNSNAKVQFIGVSTNDLAGYTTAKDAITGQTDIYAIVPLSNDTDVIAMFTSHVTSLSAPDVSKFRVVIGSGQLPTTQQIFPASGTVTSNSTNGQLGDTFFNIVDNDATFMTSGVAVGDRVLLAATLWDVLEVTSENALKLAKTAGVAVPASGAYYVDRVFTRSQQVTALSAVTNSIKNSRCVMVWPNSCLVAGVLNGKTGLQTEQPGYYVACAVGGMVAGLPPHQGFTYIGMAGIEQVFNSNTHFYDDQIDALSSAGWYVVVQDTPAALPYCLHQLTTDTTTLETGELSVIKNFDYVSYTMKDSVRGFLGRYNVIPSTMDFLASALNSSAATLQAENYPRIGAPLINFNIDSIAPLTGSKDRVEVYATVEIPRPLNRIGLHLTA